MKSSITLILFALFINIFTLKAWADEYYKEINLQGNWKFKLGDHSEWASSNFNDLNWGKIYVPARWEEEGYQGYDGFAWYRRNIEIPLSFKNRNLILELGYIDDVDEVFFNGVKIGQTGSFPPYYSTAYNAQRKYQIPINIINLDKPNCIAVRVYDSQLEGGIIRGDIRIGASDIAIVPDINLNGTWDFNIGREINESKMGEIIVPGNWENQGYYNYNGYAVYSRTFNVPSNFVSKRMVFLAGRIDDLDQLYINGKLVGQTGDFGKAETSDQYKIFRNYFIPPGVLKSGENKVELKVFDNEGEGGVMEGTVGLISQDEFIKYWKMRRIK